MADEKNQLFHTIILKSVDKVFYYLSIRVLLSTFIVFGLSSIFIGVVAAIPMSIIYFGLAGLLDFFHQQGSAKLDRRRKSIRSYNITHEAVIPTDSIVTFDISEPLNHCGFYFLIQRIKTSPMPIAISFPLCPACHSKLLEVDRIIFLGHIRIKFICKCGFNGKSLYTTEELIEQVIKLTGMPNV